MSDITKFIEEEFSNGEVLEGTSPKENLIDIDDSDFETQIQSVFKEADKDRVPGFKIEDYSKYIGGVFDPLDPTLGERRAQAQSGWTLIGNAITQGATEMVLGALEGVGYILDFEELYNKDQQAEEGFDNWFSQAIREAKEHVQEEWFPVYQTGRATEGTLWERLGDKTFWAAQGKTIGTTLSLMIPAITGAGAASSIARAVGMSKNLTQIVGGISAAMLSRKAESAMEANQSFQENYERYLQEGLSDIEAREKAGEIAASVFKHNSYMLPMDMLQYTLALKTFAGLKQGLEAAKKTTAGGIAAFGTQIVSEAAEEAWQSLSSSEAEAMAEEGIIPFGEGFGERFSEYVKDPEFHTEAFLGGLMGAVFGGAAPLARKGAKAVDNITARYVSAANMNSLDSFNKLSDEVQAKIIAKNLVANRIDSVEETLNKFEEEAQTKDNPQEYLQKVKDFREKVNYVKQQDELLQRDEKYRDNPNLRKEMIMLRLEDKTNNQNIQKWNTELSQIKDIVDARDRAVLEYKDKLNIQDKIKNIESLSPEELNIDSKQKEAILTRYKEELARVDERLNSEIEAAKEISKGFVVEQYTSPNANRITELNENIRKANFTKEVLVRNKLARLENLSKDQASREESKINKEIQTEISKEMGELVKQVSHVEARNLLEKHKGQFAEGAIRESINEEAAKETPNYESNNLAEVYSTSPFSYIKDMEELSNKIDKLKFKDKELIQNNIDAIIQSNDFGTIGEALQNITEKAGENKDFEKLLDTINDFYQQKFKKSASRFKKQEGDTVEVIEYPPGTEPDDFTIDDRPTKTGAMDTMMWQYEMIKVVDKHGNSSFMMVKEGGNLVKAKSLLTNEADVDWDAINDKDNFLPGTEVTFEVNIKGEFSPLNKGWEDFQIQVVAKDKNGKRKVIGILSAVDTALEADPSLDSLITLRREIFERVKNRKKGVVKLAITSTVDFKTGGRFGRTQEYKNVGEFSKESKKPIILGVISEKDGQRFIKGVDDQYTAYAGDSFLKKAKKGAVYMFIQNAAGNWVPARVFTKKIGNFTDNGVNPLRDRVVNKILDIFKKGTNLGDISQDIKQDVYLNFETPNRKDDIFTIYKGDKPTTFSIKALEAKETNEMKRLEDFLDDLIVQVDARKLNRGKYNSTISDRLTTNLNPKEPFHSAWIAISPSWKITGKSKVTVTPETKSDPLKENNEVEPPKPIVPKTTTKKTISESDTSPFDESDFVKPSKEELEDLKKQSAEELEVPDVDEPSPFDKAEIKPADSKKAEKETKVESDLEQKKADIERRRQEEQGDTGRLRLIQAANNAKSDRDTDPNSVFKGMSDEEIEQQYNDGLNKINEFIKIARSSGMSNEKISKAIITKINNNPVLRFFKGGSQQFSESIEKGLNEFISSSEINTKYDAELADLEQSETSKKKETTKEESKEETISKEKSKPVSSLQDKKNQRRDRTRGKKLFRIWETPSEPYQEWNREVEEKWFKESFPNTPLEILDSLIEVDKHGGQFAWGVFSEGLTKIYKHAEIGTAYHEGFHVVFNMFLTVEQQNELISAVREDGMSRIDAEEVLAERFTDYMLSEGKVKPLNEKIVDFFRRLYSLIKYYFTGQVNPELIFNRMRNKQYANLPFTREISSLKGITRHSFKVPNFNHIETFEAAGNVADAMRRALNLELENYPNISRVDFINKFLNQVITRENSEGKKYTITGLDLLLEDAYDGLLDRHNEIVEQGKNTPEIDHYFNTMLDNIIEINDDGSLPEGRYKLKRIGDLALRRLAKTEGITLNTDRATYVGFGDTTDSKIYEIDENIDKREGWQKESLETSLWGNVRSEIKTELSYIQALDAEGNPIYKHGLPVYLQQSRAFGTLIKELSDLTSSQEMIDHLEDFTKGNPEYKPLLDRIKQDYQFRTKFFNAFENTHAEFRAMLRSKNPKTKSLVYKWLHTNQSTTVGLVETWKQNFYNPIKNQLLDNEGNLKKNKTIEELYNKVKSGEGTLSDASKLFNAVGIETSVAELSALNKLIKPKNVYNDFKKNILEIIKRYLDEIDPYQEGRVQTETLRKAAYALSRVKQETQESSHNSVDDKTRYSHIQSFFVTHQLKALKNPEVRALYMKDPFYANMPWLLEMQSTQPGDVAFYRDVFGYEIGEGKKWDTDSNGVPYSKLHDKDFELMRLQAFFSAESFGTYMLPPLSDSPTAMFIRGTKHDKRNLIIDDLYNVALSEYERIKSDAPVEVKNYESRKNRFHLIPELNNHIALFKVGNEADIRKVLNEYLDTKYTELIEDFKALNLVEEKNGKLVSKEIVVSGSLERKLQEYSDNAILANTQMIALFQGDPAFYSNTLDFYKRAKEVWSPGKVLDVGAKYIQEGVEDRVVREFYKTIYLSDVYKPKNSDLVKAIKNALMHNGIPKDIAEDISNRYNNPNVTDAQAFISLDRYAEIQVGLGRWNRLLEDAVQDMKQGKPSNVSLNPLKPFMFTHRELVNGDNYFILPTQNKNSEFLLTPAMAYITKDGEITFPTEQDRLNGYNNYESSILASILDTMQRDSFEDNNRIDSVQFESAVKVGLYGEVDISNINNAVVHQLKNKDFRISQEVPDHFTNDKGKIGVQSRKLIISDITEGAEFILNNSKLSKEELIQHYQELVTADIIDSFNSLEKRFNTIEDIQKLLLEEVRKQEMGTEMEAALAITEKDGVKRFALPLFTPFHARRIETLISSVYRNQVINQKAPGGNLVQVSGVGYMNDLRVVIENNALKEVQVKVPYWMAEKYPQLFTDGKPDIKKFQELGLDKIIGYRIPTEDKYSILPLRIVGFLPRESGGGIMLPPEITVITGSDFDVDKMFIHLASIEERLDRDKFTKAIKDRVKAKPELKEIIYANDAALESFLDQLERGEEMLSESNLRLYDFYKDNEQKFRIFGRVKYDPTKSALEQSKAARDNQKLDLYWSILTNPDTFEKIINPGNFDHITELSQNVVLLQNGYTREDIAKMSKEDRNKAFNSVEGEMEVATPRTTREIFSRYMAGNALIGVFANHNVNHAIVQHSDLGLVAPIELNGRSADSLHDVSDENGKRISRNIAEFLAAVVDNAKNPISYHLNINMFTVDIANYLLRVGYSQDTVIAFMNQPVIRNLTKEFQREGETSKAYREIVAKYKQRLKDEAGEPVNTKDITTDQMFQDISGEKSPEYYARQLALLNLFDDLREQSFTLAKLVRALRTDNTGRQLTMSSNQLMGKDRTDLQEQSTFTNVDSVWDSFKMMDTFYEYGVTKMDERLGQYFPWNRTSLETVKNRIIDNLSENKLPNQNQIEYMNYEFMHFLVSEFFGDKKRNAIIEKLPTKFTEYMKEHPELSDNALLKQLLEESKKLNNKTYKVLTYKYVGKQTPELQSEISAAWLDLFDSAEHREFAKALFLYGFYTNGFHLSPKGFNHFSPVGMYDMWTNDKGQTFNDFLYNLLEETSETRPYDAFYDQFFMNNWWNSFWVPSIEYNKKSFPESISMPLKDNYELRSNQNKEQHVDFMTLDINGNKQLYKYVGGNKYVKVKQLSVKGIYKIYSKDTNFLGELATEVPIQANEIPDVETAGEQVDLVEDTQKDATQLSLFGEEVSEESKEIETSRNKLLEVFDSNKAVRDSLAELGITRDNIFALNKQELISFLKRFCK